MSQRTHPLLNGPDSSERPQLHPHHCPISGTPSVPCLHASPVKLTVTATMMITMPRMMKVMLSSRARRPSLRAPSRSPCCTLLRDCRERAEKLQKACPSVTWAWKPCIVLMNFNLHLPCHPQSRRLLRDTWLCFLQTPLQGDCWAKGQAVPGASSQGSDRVTGASDRVEIHDLRGWAGPV